MQDSPCGWSGSSWRCSSGSPSFSLPSPRRRARRRPGAEPGVRASRPRRRPRRARRRPRRRRCPGPPNPWAARRSAAAATSGCSVPATVTAASYVLADLDTGAVLAARAPHARERPASTLKILTSLVVADRLSPDTVVEGTASDLRVDGSKAGIGPGGHYTVRQLMAALLLSSGNDAAEALARALGGDAATVAAMTATAEQYGALDTRPATPSGLDGPGMASSAYDLAVLFRIALTKPLFASTIATRMVAVPRLRRQARLHARQQRPVRAVVRRGDRGEVGVHRRGAAHAGRHGAARQPSAGRGADARRAAPRHDGRAGMPRCWTWASRRRRRLRRWARWSTGRPRRRPRRRSRRRPAAPRLPGRPDDACAGRSGAASRAVASAGLRRSVAYAARAAPGPAR